jgi:phage terminase Nu1 subunit (DNA packaging protein)
MFDQNVSSHQPSQAQPGPQGKPIAPLALEGYLSRHELAEQLGVSVRTIDRWDGLRKGPPRITVGRTILYGIDSVREWLHEREQVAQADRLRSLSEVKP